MATSPAGTGLYVGTCQRAPVALPAPREPDGAPQGASLAPLRPAAGGSLPAPCSPRPGRDAQAVWGDDAPEPGPFPSPPAHGSGRFRQEQLGN